jgi:Zn-finger nucleic acid-binding protein
LSSIKSSNKILYHCDHLSCPVVMFICVLDRESDLCPKCGMIGLVMRGPVDHGIEERRDAIRRSQQEADEKERRTALQELASNAAVSSDTESAV